MTRKTQAVLLAAFLLGAATGEAQQTRAELVRSAVTAADDFQPERALEFAKAAVNPALGPMDSTWARGVHLLVQLLGESNNPDLARTWARWAMRTAPTTPIDSVNFVGAVATALRDARIATATRTSGDAVARTTWGWVARGSSEANGRITILQGAIPVPVNVRIVGGGLIPAAGLTLAAGSYEIEAAAPGYLPARVTREVLPGVTTTVSFALTSAAVASDVIAESVRQRAFSNLAPLQVTRFGSAPSCAVGAFVSRDGLVLTSYQAIRGADNVTLQPAGTAARLAAYDVRTDVAVLHVAGARTDSLPLATVIADGQSAWGFRLAECRIPTESRTRVNLWAERPAGSLQLSAAPVGATVGSALIDVDGRISGVWSAGGTAVPAPVVAAVVTAARRAVTGNQQLAVADVSRRENHLYGSVAIAADLPATSIRVSPLETWQWEALQTSGPAPLTFTGPMGRYRVEATAAGGATRQQEITVRPGATERLVVTLRSVAAAQGAGAAPVRKKSKMPWILGGVGVVGAGAALALMGGGGPPDPPRDPFGSISIRVPNP